MAKPLEYNATLVERVDLTSALGIFRIEADEGIQGGTFVPGQYMTIGLNNEERPDLGSVRRPMSIASAPEEGNPLEFYIRYVSRPESDNPLTHLLWKAKAGDRIYLRSKAVGHFTLEHTLGEREAREDDRLKVLVAAGTGLAPFVSMARSHTLRHPGASLDRYAILHGASYPDDLGYRDELRALAESHGLRYRGTISRPAEAPGWTDDTGRVEDYFKEDRIADLEASLGLETGGLRPDKALIYICGLQGTIGTTILRLLDRGYVPDNRKLRRALEVPDDAAASLFFEQYDAEPVIPIQDEAVMVPLRETLREALAAP